MSTEDFYWRHATIEKSVIYNRTCIGPATILDGKIYGWDKPQGMEPFSFPKHTSAIFSSNFDKKSIKYCSSVDKHGFYWYCTEEEAKNFLEQFYPTIFNQTISNTSYLYV